MKKIYILLFLAFSKVLEASGLVSPSEGIATKPLLNQKPQLVYRSAQDIFTPKMRSGQYLRTGILKRNATANHLSYTFGEFIEKTTRNRSIVIEESEEATDQVYKVIKGCKNELVGYTRINNKAVPLYKFNPIMANLDTASQYLTNQMLEWASGENENK